MPAKNKGLTINEQLAAYAWLQAIGTNIAAIGQTKLLSPKKKVQNEANNIIIIGNVLQSIANTAQAELTLQQQASANSKTANSINAFGSFLQAVGNALQAATTKNS